MIRKINNKGIVYLFLENRLNNKHEMLIHKVEVNTRII